LYKAKLVQSKKKVKLTKASQISTNDHEITDLSDDQGSGFKHYNIKFDFSWEDKNSQSNGSDKHTIYLQWHQIKLRIREDFKKKLIQSKNNNIEYVLSNQQFQIGFEGLSELLRIYSSLPISNAEVERGFSAVNRIKTDLRNRLSTGKLEDLMMISLNGPECNQWNLKHLTITGKQFTIPINFLNRHQLQKIRANSI